MARPRRSKRDAPDRKPKKKVSILDSEGITWVDYKDVAVARAIRVAREMALLPYSVRQVTHRSKGKRDRGDGDRDRAPRAEPTTPPPERDGGEPVEAPDAPEAPNPEDLTEETPAPEAVEESS
jgi:hypothetical protein